MKEQSKVQLAVDAYVTTELTGKERRHLWKILVSGLTPDEAASFSSIVTFEMNRKEREKKENT